MDPLIIAVIVVLFIIILGVVGVVIYYATQPTSALTTAGAGGSAGAPAARTDGKAPVGSGSSDRAYSYDYATDSYNYDAPVSPPLASPPVTDAGNLLYAFANTEYALPAGWTAIGEVGMLAKKGSSIASTFKRGADFNADWVWIHPILAYGSRTAAAGAGGLWAFASTRSAGNVGIISSVLYPATGSFAAGGGDLNADWKWVHPDLVNITKATHSIDVSSGVDTRPLIGIQMGPEIAKKVTFPVADGWGKARIKAL